MKISIIIPVYKEENNINKTIENIYKTQNNIDFEIIVSDSEQNQSTLNAITNKNIIKVVSNKGRAKQMNTGSFYANGDILLFLHADTILSVDSLVKIEKVINSGFLAGAFDLKIDSNKFIFRIIERVSSIRSRLTKIPYGDQGIFIKKDIFDRLGKFKEIPLMEEVELMITLKKKNHRIFIINSPIITSARRWKKEGIIYCTLRNWLLITLYLLGVSPNQLVKFYK